MSSKPKPWLIWLIPILAILFVIAFTAFTRLMVGKESKQEMDLGTQPFVPGESPHSTGVDSR